MDIVAHSIIFNFDGYETTSSTFAVIFHSLSTQPDIQKKLQEETDTAIPNKVNRCFLNRKNRDTF